MLRLALGICLLVSSVQGSIVSRADEPTAPANYNQALVNWLVSQFPNLNGPVAIAAEAGRAGKALGPQACVSTYEKLYAKDVLDVRVFFGYSNSEADPGVPATDLVFDTYAKASFIEILTKPCPPNLFVCGFNSDSDEPDLLTRNVEGPDGNTRTVKIRLESSSVSESNYANEHELKSAQKIQSDKVERDFLDALAHADVVLYAGHARHGTGPGFKPLPRALSLGWIDTGIYRLSRREMLAALKHADNPAALVGLYSCFSDKYYRAAIEKVAPKTGVVVAGDEAIEEEAYASALGTINAILGLECKEDFEKSLTHSKLYGFFPP